MQTDKKDKVMTAGGNLQVEHDEIKVSLPVKLYAAGNQPPARILKMPNITTVTWTMPEERQGRIKCKKHDFL